MTGLLGPRMTTLVYRALVSESLSFQLFRERRTMLGGKTTKFSQSIPKHGRVSMPSLGLVEVRPLLRFLVELNWASTAGIFCQN